jgi:hypothetical protein
MCQLVGIIRFWGLRHILAADCVADQLAPFLLIQPPFLLHSRTHTLSVVVLYRPLVLPLGAASRRFKRMFKPTPRWLGMASG